MYSPEKPQTPNGFTGANTAPLDIRLEWTALTDSENGIPEEYSQNIQYMLDVRDSNGTVVTIKTVSHPENFTIITNLPVCTNFSAILVAVNDFFTGDEAIVVVDTYDAGLLMIDHVFTQCINIHTSFPFN